jgi:trans-aconitate methyltransferase
MSIEEAGNRNSIHVWKTELYDDKLGYVSEFGKDVLSLLNPLKGEKIFDLGCGSGDLAHEIQQAGAVVTGMDLSNEMIAKARIKYPQIDFIVGNAENFIMDQSYDAVFSNAALHWMKNAKQVVESVWNILHQGGRFVAEFGGKGNLDILLKAIGEVLAEDYGIDAASLNPWYFPSIAEYSTLLEQQGFRVTYAVHFDRPTKMEDGEDGLQHWLTGFADDFFKELSGQQKEVAFEKIAARAKKNLFQNGHWHVDYTRIRIVAIKPV